MHEHRRRPRAILERFDGTIGTRVLGDVEDAADLVEHGSSGSEQSSTPDGIVLSRGDRCGADQVHRHDLQEPQAVGQREAAGEASTRGARIIVSELREREVLEHECFAALVPASERQARGRLEKRARPADVSALKGDESQVVERHDQRPVVPRGAGRVRTLLGERPEAIDVTFAAGESARIGAFAAPGVCLPSCSARRTLSSASSRAVARSPCPVGEVRSLLERSGAKHRRRLTGDRECRVEPPPPFGRMTAHPPERAARARQPQRQRAVLGDRGPAQRRTKVVVLGVQPIEPQALGAPVELGFGAFHEGRDPLRLPAPQGCRLGGRIKPLARERVDRLEHRVALAAEAKQALLDQ
jgi:hypothetical protein